MRVSVIQLERTSPTGSNNYRNWKNRDINQEEKGKKSETLKVNLEKLTGKKVQD